MTRKAYKYKGILPSLPPQIKTLLRIIERSNLSDKDILDRAGHSVNVFTHWRSGRSLPSFMAFCDVADVLGYDVILRKRVSDGSDNSA